MPRFGALLVGLAALALLVMWSLGILGTLAFPQWTLLIATWGVGLWTGSRLAAPPKEATVRAARINRLSDTLEVTGDAVDPASHELETVEGIGGGYGRRLRELGVTDTLALVEKGARAEDRAEIAQALKVEPLVVQRWTSMADLLRVPGMDGQSAEVLEAAGVPTVSALAERSGPQLVSVLLEVNDRLRLTPDDLPGVEQIQNWVGLASFLPGVVEDL